MPKDSLQLREELLACLPSLEIERLLAESGQRVVFLAHFDDSRIPSDGTIPVEEDDPDEKPFLRGWGAWGDIVVKVVAGASSDTISRLQAEVDILEEVRPVNFPKLLYSNLFTENPMTEERIERLYVTVEEFIESKSLTDHAGEYLGNERRVAEVALGIANALVPLWEHPKKFVHRDIKPANVLMRRSGEIVVIDLGIARETGAKGLTATGWGNAPLTPGYAAPEQIANDKVSICFKTDFFAIGVLMYMLCSGKEPFRPRPDMDDLEVLLATRNQHPPPLVDVAKVSQAFSDFVMKALQKEPFRRLNRPGFRGGSNCREWSHEEVPEVFP